MTDRRPPAPLTCDEVRDLAAGFVLGALEPAEMEAVRDHLASCSEAHEEVAELGGTATYLADAVEPVEPPSALGARIVAAVAAEAGAGAAPSGAVPAAATESGAARPEPAPPAVAMAGTTEVRGTVTSLDSERRRRRPILAWVAAVAAVLLIVALGAWGVSLRRDLDAAQAYGAAVDQVLAVAGSPGGQAALLTSAEPGGPSGIAGLGADGSIEIAVRGLAPISGTEVYEAWVVGSDGVPVAIGSFTPNAAGFGSLATTSSVTGPGVTIGLTREPTPGRTTPTPPMIVSGVAAGTT